jgi:cyclopropane fatty-acyl-phospholipid synthase-like methyltransferase
MAEAGFTVHGLDFSENMLEMARRKIEERGLSDRISLTHADMANFDLEEKGFSLAFVAARSFMHLFTQEKQLSCLDRFRRHLRPGGLFLMDLYAPSFRMLSRIPEDEFKFLREFTLPGGNRVVHKRQFVGVDLVNQVTREEILFEEYHPDGELIHTKRVPMDTRYTFRFELELLLEKAGFEVRSIFRDYERNPYDGTGEIIAVAQKLA